MTRRFNRLLLLPLALLLLLACGVELPPNLTAIFVRMVETLH